MDGILALADSAPDMEDASYKISYKTQEPVRIGVACDEAISFYYEDNFRILIRYSGGNPGYGWNTGSC